MTGSINIRHSNNSKPTIFSEMENQFNPNKVIVTVGDNTTDVVFTPRDYLYYVEFGSPLYETVNRVVNVIKTALPEIEDILPCIKTFVGVSMEREYHGVENIVNGTEQSTYPGMNYSFFTISTNKNVRIKPVFNWVKGMSQTTVIKLTFSWGEASYSATSVGGMVYAWRKEKIEENGDRSWSAYVATKTLMSIDEFRKMAERHETTEHEKKLAEERLANKVKEVLSSAGITLTSVVSSYDEDGGVAVFEDSEGTTVSLTTTRDDANNTNNETGGDDNGNGD